MRSLAFATPHSKNPAKSSVPSYQNVNHTFWNVQFQKEFSTPQTSVLGSFGKNELLFLEKKHILFIDRKAIFGRVPAI